MTAPRFARAALAASLLAATVLPLAACADARGPGDYAPWEAGTIAQVEEGVVVSHRYVEFGPNDTGEGTVLGGVGGALVGSALAGRGSRGAGAVLGAIGGAIVGTAVEGSNRAHGFAYLIRRRDGRLVEVAQAGGAPIPDGTRVAVTYGPGRRARVALLAGDGPPPGPYGPPGAYPPGGGYPPPPPPPGAYGPGAYGPNGAYPPPPPPADRPGPDGEGRGPPPGDNPPSPPRG